MCDCETCIRSRRYSNIIYKLSNDDDIEFMEGVMNTLVDTEDDLNHKQAILDGSWPSAVEKLGNSLMNALEIREKKKKQ